LFQSRQDLGSAGNWLRKADGKGIPAGVVEGASFAMHYTRNGEIESEPALKREIGAAPQSIDYRSK
jgi:hypothetical protein